MNKIGDIRFIKRFLFLPRFINGRWQWLKNVNIRQEYQKNAFAIVSNYTDEIESYEDGWVDKEDSEYKMLLQLGQWVRDGKMKLIFRIIKNGQNFGEYDMTNEPFFEGIPDKVMIEGKEVDVMVEDIEILYKVIKD